MSYYIISQRDDNGQQWAVTMNEAQTAVVVQQFQVGATYQKWDICFQQGATKAGIAFVCNGMAIAYTSNNEALGLVPFSPTSSTDDSIWVMQSNAPNPWYLIVNPDNGWGQIWDINGGDAEAGHAIYTWNENGGSNQRWCFQNA